MKINSTLNLLKVAFLLFLGSFELQAQNYLNETARWEQYTSYYQSSSSNSYCFKTYYIEGDTIANGNVYYRLMLNSNCRFVNTNLDSTGQTTVDTMYVTSTSFNRFIREENKVFYIYDAALNSESWLYNFNINEPVSIDSAVQFPEGCGVYPELLSHDTVCIGNIGRKQWSLTQGLGAVQTFIEGVGPGSGLFANICNPFCPECGAGLIHFMLNGDTLYRGSCSIPAGIAQYAGSKANVNAYLQSGTLVVDAEEIETLTLFSTSGKQLVNYGKCSNPRIPLNGFSPGVYIYSINTRNGVTSGKIVYPGS